MPIVSRKTAVSAAERERRFYGLGEARRMFAGSSRWLTSLAACLALTGSAAAADCGALIAAFRSAIDDKAFVRLKDAMAAIADDSACNFDIDAYRIQEINSVIDMADTAPPGDAQKQMIEFVDGIIEIGGDWRSAERLGDYYARHSESQEALNAYETAISRLSRAAPPASQAERKELDRRVEQLRKGASD
jgi:hypothetical protein